MARKIGDIRRYATEAERKEGNRLKAQRFYLKNREKKKEYYKEYNLKNREKKRILYKVKKIEKLLLSLNVLYPGRNKQTI
jgi:hypothetical protein